MAKHNVIEYKYECYWSQQDGWHFSFGSKHLWEYRDKKNAENTHDSNC